MENHVIDVLCVERELYKNRRKNIFILFSILNRPGTREIHNTFVEMAKPKGLTQKTLGKIRTSKKKSGNNGKPFRKK